MEIYYALKVAHVVVASIWIGAGLLAPRDVRQTLLAGPLHVPALMGRLRTTAQAMNTSALLTVVTGLLLVFAGGGIAAMPLRIHVGLALTIAAYVVGRWAIRPRVVEIARSTDKELSNDEALKLATRFGRAVNLEHGLRLAVLVLMVYPVAL
jgi:hypothetical protein